MKIRMLCSISGLDFSLSRGEETERFTDDDALRLIKAGNAVLVSVQTVETAVVTNPGTETAAGVLIDGAGLAGADTGAEITTVDTVVDADAITTVTDDIVIEADSNAASKKDKGKAN